MSNKNQPNKPKYPVAVIAQYPAQYERFIEDTPPPNRSIYKMVNTLEDIKGRTFSDYIVLGPITNPHSASTDELIDRVKRRIRQ